MHDLKRLEAGIVIFDSVLQQDVLVIAPVLAVLADNPRHSELLNHLGGGSNLYCRMCMVRYNGNIIVLSFIFTVCLPLR